MWYDSLKGVSARWKARTYARQLNRRHVGKCPYRGTPMHDTSLNGFGGLEVACWPLVPKFVGSHPAEAVRFLGRKNP